MRDATNAYRKIIAALVVVGSLLFGVVGFILYDSYLTTWVHAVDTSTNLVTALQRDISRTIETYDLSLKAALRARRAPELAQLSPETRQQLLFDGAIEARHLGSVFILDGSGHIVDESSSLTPRQGSFADRDFFTAQRDRTDAGLYVSKPFRNHRDSEWSIAISRRITGADGEFDGVVVGAIHFRYFAELFSKLHLGPGGGISVFNLDGTMLYHEPFAVSQIGRDFSDASIFREIHAGHTAPYEDVARTDGVARLFAFAIIDGLPLVLSVNTAVSTIYADWITKAILTCVVSTILVIAGCLLARAARAEQRRRLAAERLTIRSGKMLNAFFEHSPDALFVIAVNPDGRLTYEDYNPACAMLTGLVEGEAIGKGPQEVFLPEVGAAIEQRYRKCVETRQVYCYDETRQLPAGRRDWHSMLCPIMDENGVVTLIVGSARDMTEVNKRTEERHQSNTMEAVGRLTAGVAHNFNNQLQTISSSLEMLEADYLAEPEAAEYGEMAREATTVSARLTHGLLAFSRQQILRPRRVTTASLIGQASRAAGAATFSPGIHVKIVIEAFTDDIQVDPAQAERCLLNLLVNAREAMPEGGNLVIHARNAGPSDGACGTLLPENIVIIAVHDTGCGMDEAVRTRAFEPFFTTKKFGSDSGLGLSMAQGFCNQSGGDIRILSDGHTGTRVELWLPASAASGLAGQDVNANLTDIGQPVGRLLLVEGDQGPSLILVDHLVSGGFEVVAVKDGREGLAMLDDREPFDAVIADASLPDMTGAAFLTQVARQAPLLATMTLGGWDADDVSAMPPIQPGTLLTRQIGRADLLSIVRETVGDTRSAWAA